MVVFSTKRSEKARGKRDVNIVLGVYDFFLRLTDLLACVGADLIARIDGSSDKLGERYAHCCICPKHLAKQRRLYVV
jgi:hypothetical protein